MDLRRVALSIRITKQACIRCGATLHGLLRGVALLKGA
jgi:hypothetical protein